PAASGRFGVVGYCWGGSQVWNYAVRQPDLSAAVVYYGSGPREPADYTRITCPVLGLYGSDDERVNATIPMSQQAMSEAGKSFVKHVYEGAGHGFLRQQTGREGANLAASKQAWAETITFFRRHLE
ncbi:MAG: dienelactone hydrolase family protein, partial [Phycisphaerae bacterium]|nr:dienelactone hydrolase family protein [Phycisphaerae bacterium]